MLHEFKCIRLHKETELSLQRSNRICPWIQTTSYRLLCFAANLKTGRRRFLFWLNKTILFSSLQLDALRSLKMKNNMNIVDNYRPVQNLGSRKVKSSFSSTLIGEGVALKISNVVLLMALLLKAVFCPWMIRQSRSSAKRGSRGCYSV